MNATIDNSLVLAFKNNLDVKFQQEGSRLRHRVRQEVYRGQSLFIDRVTPTTATVVTTRNAQTVYNDVTFDRRMLTASKKTFANLIDDFDRVRMLADPQNPILTEGVYALGRQIDTEFMTSATGTAFGGKTGTTAVTFPAGNIIAATYDDTGGSASTSLTIGKLRKARQQMDEQEALNPIFMGSMKPFVVTPAHGLHSLLTFTPTINANYNTVRALVDGHVDTFMGFDFVRLGNSFFTVPSGTLLAALAIAPMAMCVGVTKDIEANITRMPTNNWDTQIYAQLFSGSVRLWEEGVIQINVDTAAV